MSIESLLETGRLIPTAVPASLCTAVIGGGTISVTVINAAMVSGAVLLFVADDGSWQWHVQNGAPAGVGPYTITIFDTVRKTASGAAGNTISTVQMNSNFFAPTTTFPSCRAFAFAGDSGQIDQLLKSPSGSWRISANEGVRIKSFYVRLPYQFTFAESQIPVRFSYRIAGVGGVSFDVPEIGEQGVIFLPVENIEVPLDVYIPPKGVAGQSWELLAKFNRADSAAPTDTRSVPATEMPYTHISTLDMNTSIAFEFLPITIGVRLVHAATALT